MREIKFRVYSKGDAPKMLYLWPNDTYFTSDDLVESEDWKLMQFTGLLDKNGKEIYEGDILSYQTAVNGKFTFQILWNPADVKFEGHTSKRENMEMSLTKGQAGDFYEIIGNIYQNPELVQ